MEKETPKIVSNPSTPVIPIKDCHLTLFIVTISIIHDMLPHLL